jgi:hypothetical protein
MATRIRYSADAFVYLPGKRRNRPCEVMGRDLSGLRGGFNGSTQHQLEVHLQAAQQLKACRER